MVGKGLKVQGSMALGFVDLEKAFDTVPRDMAMATATLRWMGVHEAEVMMVEGTYEKTAARVMVEEGASEEFEVTIGLRQGSVLSPLLLIAVLDLVSRKTVVKDHHHHHHRQPLCPVVGRMPQHAVSKLPYLVLSSAISCRSSICLGRLSTDWLVSLVVFSCHMVSKW